MYVCMYLWEWREKKVERNINMRNIDQLPPVHTLTRDWTANLGMWSETKYFWIRKDFLYLKYICKEKTHTGNLDSP